LAHTFASLYFGRKPKARVATFHDFNFNIIHCARSKCPNVDALSKNPMGCAKEEKDF
jgi:hypothetical protein